MQIEAVLFNGFLAITGSPLLLGLIVLAVLFVIMIVLKLDPGAMFFGLLCAGLGVASFIVDLRIVIALGVGIMLAMALIKITRG